MSPAPVVQPFTPACSAGDHDRWETSAQESDDATPLHFCGTQSTLSASLVQSWRKRGISWSITGALPGLPAEEFRRTAQQAFAGWAAVCNLRFSEALPAVSPDILIRTGPIDGPGKVLAWSELPDGRDAQLKQLYDTGERYANAASPPGGTIDLLAVMTHEIGHALGLEHAANGSPDLMAPVYQPGRRVPQEGDVRRMQTLYGPATAPPVQPPVQPPVLPPVGAPVVIRIYGADRIEVDGYSVKKNA